MTAPATRSSSQRSSGLAAAARLRRSELLRLADALAARADAEVLSAPAPASLLLEMSAPVGSFCAGEVVVTVATARLGGRDGWGCVLGWDDAGALAAALCDAAPTPEVEELAAAALADQARERTARSAAVAATRVGG